MNTVAEFGCNDLAPKKSCNGLLLLFFLPVMLVLPPLWSFFALVLLFRNCKQNVVSIVLLSGFLALCFIYTTPIWDTIAHQYRYLYLMNHDLKEDFSWMSKDWFYRLEILFTDVFGKNTPFMCFWYLVYFGILLSWYSCASKQAEGAVSEVMLWLFAMMGFLPILGYTRNALAFAVILLPGLAKRLTFGIAILLFCVAYNLHDCTVLIAPCLLIYLLPGKSMLGRNVLLFLLILFAFMIILPRTGTLTVSEDIINNARVAVYSNDRGRFRYGSDYIYVTLSLGWCAFMLYNALRYKDKTNAYFFSIFIVSAGIYFAAFIMSLYTIRIRFQIIAIASGVFATYPVIKAHFSRLQWQILKLAVSVSFLGYLLLVARPVLLSPAFQSPELCRTICWKILYVPTYFLLDINTHGFADWIFKTTTWWVS